MRSILRVNLTSGQCRFETLSRQFAVLGGRGLASMLVFSAPDNTLAIAPGLLSGGMCASSGRTAVACKNPVDSTIFAANAGGMPGEALARLGIAAVLLEGAAPPDIWQDLIIDAGGACLARSSVSGVNTYEAMAALAQQYGENCSFITIGKAGEACLPVATVAFSDRGGQPARHAGGCSGAVMGSKRLKAIIIQKTAAHPPIADKHAFGTAAGRFADALRTYGRDTGGHDLGKGCAQGCMLACRDGSAGSVKEDGGIGKWPDYMSLWSASATPGTIDYANLDRYAYLCNDLGVDAFSVGERLVLLSKQGVLERGNAESALALLEFASRDPRNRQASRLFEHTKGAAETAKSKTRTEGSVILDSLGICRFAFKALAESERARTALAEMLKARFGSELFVEGLRASARSVLDAEHSFDPLWPGALSVSVGQDVEPVRKSVHDVFEAFGHSFGAARQIDDQAFSPDARSSPAEHGPGGNG